MRDTHRTMLAFLSGRAAFGATFLVCAVAQWPTLWYLPLARRWVFASSVRELGMDWYGRSLTALTVGLVVGALTWAAGGVASLAPRLARPAVMRWVAQLGAMMLLFDVAFYVLTLTTRVIEPPALPAWYQPR